MGVNMSDDLKRTGLETEAIVIGYAMSRLDIRYLSARKFSTWKEAYREATNVFSNPIATFKNLRDEFDPIHANIRRGWQRPLRADRERVINELKEVSDEA